MCSQRYFRASVSVLLLLSMQACSSLATSDCSADNVSCAKGSGGVESDLPLTLGVTSFRPEHLIATDMVNALTQLQPYNVPTTTIKVPDGANSFARELENVLVNRGYRIKKSPQKTGEGVLMASVVRSDAEAWQYTYMIAINRVAMKRNYYIGEDRVVAPMSSLYIRGAAPDMVQLNDGLFLE